MADVNNMMKLEVFQPFYCKLKLQYIEICTYFGILFACSPSVSLSVYKGSPVEFSADLGCRTTENVEPCHDVAHATSVPSERVFSVAGLTVSKLRASLDRDTVNEILFLHKHLKGTITDLLKQFPNDEVQAQAKSEKSVDTLAQTSNPDSGLLSDENFEIKQEVQESDIADFLPEAVRG